MGGCYSYEFERTSLYGSDCETTYPLLNKIDCANDIDELFCLINNTSAEMIYLCKNRTSTIAFGDDIYPSWDNPYAYLYLNIPRDVEISCKSKDPSDCPKLIRGSRKYSNPGFDPDDETCPFFVVDSGYELRLKNVRLFSSDEDDNDARDDFPASVMTVCMDSIPNNFDNTTDLKFEAKASKTGKMSKSGKSQSHKSKSGKSKSGMSRALSGESVQDKIFTLCDINKDGMISREEVSSCYADVVHGSQAGHLF